MIVYLITNRVNGKVYVGKYAGDDPFIRWSAHVRRAQLGARQHLSNAIRKYGAGAFDIKVLESCDSEEELNAREVFHIARLQSNKVGYNMTTGGEGFSKGNTHRVGKKLSADHKARIAQANSKPKSPETIERMRTAQRNRKNPYSLESQRKMSEAQKRRVHLPHTEETKRKMSLAKKGKPLCASQLAAVRALGIARRGIPLPEMWRKNIGHALKGKPCKPETIVKIRAALVGREVTQETREAMRRAKLGVPRTPECRKQQSISVRRTRLRNHMDHVRMWMGVTA
jgi:group I intron endonuclease